MLIELKQLNIQEDDLELFISKKERSFDIFLNKYIYLSSCPNEYIIPSRYKNKMKDTVFFHVEDLKIYQQEEIYNKYKESLNIHFKTLKELKKIDYNKLIELKNNEVYKYKNHKEKQCKYDGYTWHQLQFLIIFINLLNEGYFPVNYRLVLEKNEYKHIIYYI